MYPNANTVENPPAYYAGQAPPPGFHPGVMTPHGPKQQYDGQYSGQYGRQYSNQSFSDQMEYSRGSETEEAPSNMFTRKSVRQAFIRKVYSILSIQLLFTLAVTALFIFCEPVKDFVQKNAWVHLSAILAFVATYLVLVCCESCRRKTPTNYICMGILTVTLSYMTGAVSSKYDTDIVFLALAMTAAITVSLTIFAIQTKVDFTMCSGFLCVATMVVVVMGFGISMATLVFGYSKILHLVYAGLSALLFSLYIVYDTQVLIGGRKYALSEEEYILASIQLYLDIVMLFMQLLQVLSLVIKGD